MRCTVWHVCLLAVLLAAGASDTAAQSLDLPTLDELGIRYVSPDGFVQIKPSARVERSRVSVTGYLRIAARFCA